MRPRRTVLPLPSYTRRVWSKARGNHAYYFEPPTWSKEIGPEDPRGECPVGPEALGTDYDVAVQRVEKVLLPLWHSWRTGGVLDLSATKARPGTLDWLFAEYRSTDKFKKLGRGQRRLHEAGFALIGQHPLKDGRTLGALKLEDVDTGVVDRLYEKLLPLRDAEGNPVPQRDADGQPVITKHGEPVFVERRTTVNHAMKSCRRAWNVVFRLHRNLVPAANPFSRMGLVGSTGSVVEATYADLTAFVTLADARGLASLAAAAMVTYEWLQREEHIFTAFKLAHYRPKEKPDEVLIVHPKTGAEVWIPLFDKKGKEPIALFPELMKRMDALKRDRIGDGLFFRRDWGSDRKPWATAKGQIDLVRKKTKELILAAGLRDKLSFTSFRHGGFTELGDAELTDAQIRALSRQKSPQVVKGYVKRTQQQIIDGTKKRRAVRPAAAAQADAAAQLDFETLLNGDPS